MAVTSLETGDIVPPGAPVLIEAKQLDNVFVELSYEIPASETDVTGAFVAMALTEDDGDSPFTGVEAADVYEALQTGELDGEVYRGTLEEVALSLASVRLAMIQLGQDHWFAAALFDESDSA
jgi:hypothetical protein